MQLQSIDTYTIKYVTLTMTKYLIGLEKVLQRGTTAVHNRSPLHGYSTVSFIYFSFHILGQKFYLPKEGILFHFVLKDI